MTRSNPFCLLFGLLLLSLVACKKDDDTTETPEPTTKTDFLTLQPWKPVSDKINGNELIQDCQKDDKYTFSDNGNHAIDFGPLRCNTELNVTNNTWAFANNETTLVITAAGGSAIPYELITVNRDSLVLKFGLEVITYLPY